MQGELEELKQDELATLKARADMLGIAYHPSIGIEKLRLKVTAAIEGEAEAIDEEGSAESTKPAAPKETEGQRRLRLKKDAEKLVRVRITCMNPAKKEWEGEIFTVGNAAVGTFKKYVPFNADDGWHVPNIIYQMLQDRQCQVFITAKDARGNRIRQGKMIKEFAIEVLPALTSEELQELAQRQAMSKSVA